ncbi:hypothetical protein D3C86_1391690 [compost metagenome]
MALFVAGLPGSHGSKFAQVVARGEHATFASHHDGPDGRVALGACDGIGQTAIHRIGQCVHLLRPGQREGQDTLGGFDGHVFGHRFSWLPSRTAREGRHLIRIRSICFVCEINTDKM